MKHYDYDDSYAGEEGGDGGFASRNLWAVPGKLQVGHINLASGKASIDDEGHLKVKEVTIGPYPDTLHTHFNAAWSKGGNHIRGPFNKFQNDPYANFDNLAKVIADGNTVNIPELTVTNLIIGPYPSGGWTQFNRDKSTDHLAGNAKIWGTLNGASNVVKYGDQLGIKSGRGGYLSDANGWKTADKLTIDGNSWETMELEQIT